MHRLSRESAHLAGRLLMGALGLGVALMLSGCPGKDKSAASGDTSQIVAQVNDSEISIHQVEAMLAAQPAIAEQLGANGPRRALDSLIDQELAAQAARQAGLDKTHRVLQAMELAKREVLARAYQDQLAEKAIMPDTEAVNRYYDSHPELFAKRRQYTLQETLVKAPTDKALELKDKVEKLATVEAVNALVNDSGLTHSRRNSVQWAEGVPMDLLSQLAYLKTGQSLGVPRRDGLVILTLLNAEEMPMSSGQASNAIQAALLSNSRRELVQKGMEALRQQAKVQRMGAFAQAASGASAP